MISPTFVIMILRVTASHHYSERRAFIMPKKVSVKPILELSAAGISMSKIENLMHVSRHIISAGYKAADVHSVSCDNVMKIKSIKCYSHLFLRLLFLKKSITINAGDVNKREVTSNINRE